MATNLSGLKNFTKKLANYGGIDKNFKGKFVKAIVNEGKIIAMKEYGSSNITSVNVKSTYNKNGEGTISAEGKGIAYIEFGTGTQGQNSNYPKEKLPTQTIEFESPKGSPQSTQGWEYNYDNPQTKKVNEDGELGWYFNGQFTDGRKAGMQMYRTSKELRSKLPSIAKKVMSKEVKKNG
jgi:hypothetical protein